MTGNSGMWLHDQRRARGWSMSEMARQLRMAAAKVGDTLPAHTSLVTMIRRWESGDGLSERYRLHYCAAFGLKPDQFGQAPLPRAAQAPALPPAVRAKGLPMPKITHGRDLPSGQQFNYRETKAPNLGESPVMGGLLMTAHESSDHAERSETREIGEATLEQMRADVIRLSHEFMTAEPLPLFLEMRRVRNRMHDALDRRLWPRDATELYFLLSSLNMLMAVAAKHLGNPSAAAELLRAAWAYAVVIDNRALQAHLRGAQANLAFWAGQPRQCVDLAGNGLEYRSTGQVGANLHLMLARGAGRLGDSDQVRAAIASANDAVDRDTPDDAMAIGGEFEWSDAYRRYAAGFALLELPQSGTDATPELETAITLYEQLAPGEGSQVSANTARINLATASLRTGRLDAAADAVEPVLALPPAKRVYNLSDAFTRVRTELAAPIYRGSPQARDLDTRIEHFNRETIVTDLHGMASTPA